jgi:tetratricopeptide (TPR) repeat protein
MAKEKYDLAVVHFKKAVQLKPDYSLAKNNLGSAYLARKEWDKAIIVLEEVTGDMLYATPHFPLANLGWAYYNKGDYDKARKYLEGGAGVAAGIFYRPVESGQDLPGHRPTAHRALLFEAAAQLNPKDPGLLLELGRTYRLLGDYNNARMALKAAIEYTDDSNWPSRHPKNCTKSTSGNDNESGQTGSVVKEFNNQPSELIHQHDPLRLGWFAGENVMIKDDIPTEPLHRSAAS